MLGNLFGKKASDVQAQDKKEEKKEPDLNISCVSFANLTDAEVIMAAATLASAACSYSHPYSPPSFDQSITTTEAYFHIFCRNICEKRKYDIEQKEEGK